MSRFSPADRLPRAEINTWVKSGSSSAKKITP